MNRLLIILGWMLVLSGCSGKSPGTPREASMTPGTPSTPAAASSANKPATEMELLAFVRSELDRSGIQAPDSDEAWGDDAWSVKHDDVGFVLTASEDAHAPLKRLLDSAFEDPKFNDNETLIYRDDHQKLTAMLNREPGKTELIFLRWKDSKARAQLDEAVNTAMTQVVENATTEMQRLLTAAADEPDEAKRNALFEKAHRIAEELHAAISSETDSNHPMP